MIQKDKHNNYLGFPYDTKSRFISYWHQISEIISLKPENILEIGIGNGFVSEYLKRKNFNITTLDIDSNLKPDIVGSVLSIPLTLNSFDVVACFEVLEHLEYKNFDKALRNINKVCKRYAILSLPDRNIVCRIYIQIPKIGKIQKLISLPRIKKPNNYIKEHSWEIGGKGYSLNKIIADIENTGFKIEKTYRIFEFPWHRFFILKKC